MIWAFIDLENIGSLDTVSLKKYDSVYIFVGAKQSKISFTPITTNTFTNIKFKVLKINESSKDNLDFHLSYYLGKFDSITNKNICFTILSNDTGFDNLISHINSTGRDCKRLGTKSSNNTSRKETELDIILKNLLKKETEKLPKTEKALRNHIKSHLLNSKSERNINEAYNHLIKNKKIANRILKKQIC